MTNAKFLSAAAAIVLVSGVVFDPSSASAVDFSGKKITALVTFKEGGGMDKITRLFAPFFGKYLPGHPTVLVRNMPGGGGIRGNNWFHNNAKPDGMTYVGVTTSTQTGFLLGGKKVKYNMKTWKYIMATPRGTVVYARPETGVKGKNIRDDITALRNAQIITGAKTPTSAELRLFLAMELLGIKNVKPVFGLSTGGQRKAILRGEVNINYDSAGSFLKHVVKYVKKRKVVPLMTLGFTKENGDVVRDPGFPNMPNIVDAYKAMHGGKAPSGTLWEAYKNFYTMGVMTSKGFALPPKTPKKIVDAYLAAAKKIIKDKKFLKVAEKELGNYPIHFGRDARKDFMDAIDVTPDVKAFMANFIRKKFDVNI